MNSFGKKLRELREEQNLTQPQLAKELGVSNAVISYWENDLNEPKASHIEKLANFFNVSTDYLIKPTETLEYITVFPTAPDLSEIDQNLLTLFHSMTHAQQVRFLAYGEGITGITVSKIPKN